MAPDVSKLNNRYRKLTESLENNTLLVNGGGSNKKCISTAVEEFKARNKEGNVTNDELVNAALGMCRFLKEVEKACNPDMIAKLLKKRTKKLTLEQYTELLGSDNFPNLERVLFSRHPELLQDLQQSYNIAQHQNTLKKTATPATPASCSICYRDYDTGERAPILLKDCRHVFCFRCLEQISGSNGIVQCPNCRKNSFTRECCRIYL